jgi:hypothetical protein
MPRIQQIKYPSLADPDLAYETGVHIGDGCMQVNEPKHDYRVTFWGSREELEYYEHTLKPILTRLYGLKNVKVKKVSTESTIYLRLCSKQLVIFKHEKLGLPIGKKSQMSSLPAFVKEPPKLLKECISGIADTDGSLTFLKKDKKIHDYPRISISISNELLMNDINTTLRKLKFKTVFYSRVRFDKRTGNRYSHWEIDMNGREMLEKWMKEIGFRNKVHLCKYKLWKSHGFVPIR